VRRRAWCRARGRVELVWRAVSCCGRRGGNADVYSLVSTLHREGERVPRCLIGMAGSLWGSLGEGAAGGPKGKRVG
jgi:hypothetical protein